MNSGQRKEIEAIIVLIYGVRDREKQNLIDTPDNIELHGEIKLKFGHSINYLGEAVKCLLEAK